MNILVINGPNLNLLGKREPEIYGHETLEELMLWLETSSESVNIEFKFYQSNYEGEIIDTIESTMTLKMIDRRYQVWEWREGEFLSYTVTTYDYDASRYRWWGTSSDWTSIFEHSGQRYLRNLIEWKAVNLPDPELQSTMRTTFVSEDGKRFKVIGKITRNGEVESYSTSDFTWHSELPEEHRLREAEETP